MSEARGGPQLVRTAKGGAGAIFLQRTSIWSVTQHSYTFSGGEAVLDLYLDTTRMRPIDNGANALWEDGPDKSIIARGSGTSGVVRVFRASYVLIAGNAAGSDAVYTYGARFRALGWSDDKLQWSKSDGFVTAHPLLGPITNTTTLAKDTYFLLRTLPGRNSGVPEIKIQLIVSGDSTNVKIPSFSVSVEHVLDMETDAYLARQAMPGDHEFNV